MAPTTAGAASSQLSWQTIANLATDVPGTTTAFNSFSQPSINTSGMVVFRARSKGPSVVRGIYSADVGGGPQPPTVNAIAQVGDTVPQPNNNGGTFNEFPSFPRIGVSNSVIATRGQSTPVWTYDVNGVSTTVGTSGIYATQGGNLGTSASLLGSVSGQEIYAVPGATAGTRFDQFPGSPAVDGNDIAFKGNYTDGTTSGTGIFYRDGSQPTASTELIANIATVIPGQSGGGTVPFGATAPPSAADGHVVFTGWDNEAAPTIGGVYLAPLSPSPTITPLVTIGEQVPGQAAGDTFTNFGEGLSFDGRFVGLWGTWGSATTDVTLMCPSDGNSDLLAYCLQQYPNGFTTSVPVHQGIFVYDTVTQTLTPVAATGSRFQNFDFWTFSGSPPNVGNSTDSSRELPRWRPASFVAVSGLSGGAFQVAFKGNATTGDTAIFLAQGPSAQERVFVAVKTFDTGSIVDSAAPVDSVVTGVSIERDGFRGRWLAIGVTMLDPVTSTGWAGIYATHVPTNLATETQTITAPAAPPAYISDSYDIAATSSAALPVTYAVDATSTPGACTLNGGTVSYTGLGDCVVNVNQAGDAAYDPQTLQLTFHVTLKPQVITSPTPPAAYLTHTYALQAASDSGLAVEYSLDAETTAGACTLDAGTLTYLAVGTCVVDVNQPGDATYAAAEQYRIFIEIAKHPQVISTGTLPSPVIGATVSLHATSDSGLPVAYSLDASSTANACTLVGASLTFNASGACYVDVSQPGDATYAAAPIVRMTFDIGLPPAGGWAPAPLITQVIDTGVAPAPTVGDTFDLNASSDSGLPVSYSVDPSSANVCSLSGETVTFTSIGSCVLVYNQAGDAVYLPASEIRQLITVAGISTTVTLSTTSNTTTYGGETTVVATVVAEGAQASGTVQFAVDGVALGTPQAVVDGQATSPALVDSSGAPLEPGKYTVTATFVPSDALTYASAHATSTQVVKKAAPRVVVRATRTTLSAQVLTRAPATAVATGRVVFRVNGRVVGVATLKNAKAVLRYKVTTGRVVRVVATYQGDAHVNRTSVAKNVRVG